jgi:hypothetical protein
MEQHDSIPEMERPADVPAIREALDFPDWIPRSVGNLAQIKSDDLHRQRAEPEIWELLRRLVSDSRMKNVWNELQRRKRQDYQRTEHFVHPATPRSCWFSQASRARRRAEELRQRGGRQNEDEASRWEWLAVIWTAVYGESFWGGRRPELPPQELAIAFLFNEAFTLGQRSIRPVPISEAQKTRRRYLKMAERIRADAAEHERLGHHLVDRLWDAVFAYEEIADAAAPPPGNPLLVERQHRNDQRMQGFVMALAAITRQVFGAPLYGTIAVVANVVLGRDDVTAGTVRKLLPRTPCP